MSEIAIIIGDFGMTETLLNKVFISVFFVTPIILRNGLDGTDHFLNVCKADTVFIRIDEPSVDGLHLTRKIHKNHPDIRLVWAANDGSYAMSAFEEGVDAFLELPVTEARLEDVQKRLNRLSKNALGTM